MGRGRHHLQRGHLKSHRPGPQRGPGQPRRDTGPSSVPAPIHDRTLQKPVLSLGTARPTSPLRSPILLSTQGQTEDLTTFSDSNTAFQPDSSPSTRQDTALTSSVGGFHAEFCRRQKNHTPNPGSLCHTSERSAGLCSPAYLSARLLVDNSPRRQELMQTAFLWIYACD